jgi:RsiW-degrading membrane proteinase PrsW (M82 family)
VKLQLVIEGSSLHGRILPLGDGWLMAGRAPECALRFDAVLDKTVSARHAIIQREISGWVVYDQKSRNGTFVNGVRVQRAQLQPGDVVELGPGGPRLMLAPVAEAEPASRPPLPDPPIPARPPSLHDTITTFGLYNPEKERGQTSTWIGAAVAVIIGGGVALLVLVVMLLSLGVTGTLVGTVAAFIPAPFYLAFFLWLDRYDPEPAWAITAAFAWGALVGVLVSFVVNTFFGAVAAALAGAAAGDALSSIISAPVIEEGIKGLGVILFWLLLRREFDDVLDGVMYAGVIAIGFATVENVLYYGGMFLKEGVGGLVPLVILRGVLSPYSHALFTCMTGIGCGLARETHRRGLKVALPLAGLVMAMFLHALWNAVATFTQGFFFVFYLVVWLPLFAALFGLVIGLVVREGRIIRRMLAVEVATGRITESELKTVGSFWNRLGWPLAALPDWRRFTARRRFLRAVTKLAFCFWHVERAEASRAQTISLPLIPRFRAEVKQLHPRI